MRFRNRLVLFIAPFALILTGCFQQAGTALQEPIATNQAVENLPNTPIPLPTQSESGTGSSDGGQGQTLNTPTVPGLISTEPITDVGSGDLTNPPVALTIISATLPPLATVYLTLP